MLLCREVCVWATLALSSPTHSRFASCGLLSAAAVALQQQRQRQLLDGGSGTLQSAVR